LGGWQKPRAENFSHMQWKDRGKKKGGPKRTTRTEGKGGKINTKGVGKKNRKDTSKGRAKKFEQLKQARRRNSGGGTSGRRENLAARSMGRGGGKVEKRKLEKKISDDSIHDCTFERKKEKKG